MSLQKLLWLFVKQNKMHLVIVEWKFTRIFINQFLPEVAETLGSKFWTLASLQLQWETAWVVGKPLKQNVMILGTPFYFSNFTCEIGGIGLVSLNIPSNNKCCIWWSHSNMLPDIAVEGGWILLLQESPSHQMHLD